MRGESGCLFFMPNLAVETLDFATVSEVGSRTECFKVEFRSYLWQLRKFKTAKSWPAAIRLFTVGNKARSIIEVVAEYAFFSLSYSFCQKIAEHEQIAITGEKGNFPSLLFHLIQGILKTSNSDTLTIVMKRIGQHDMDATLMPTLIGLDETLDIVDQRDAKAIKNDQEWAANAVAGHQQFLADYADSALIQSIFQQIPFELHTNSSRYVVPL